MSKESPPPVSDELAGVLTGWLALASSDDPGPRVTDCGLCAYTGHFGGPAYVGLTPALKHWFPNKYGYPFDRGAGWFDRSSRRGVMHLNPLRRAFAHALIAMHKGEPPPAVMAHIGGCYTRADGTTHSSWSRRVKARIKGVHLEVKFYDRWRRVRALPELEFGFTAGGQAVTVNNVVFGATEAA